MAPTAATAAAGQYLTCHPGDAEAMPDSEAASLLQPEAAEGSGTQNVTAPYSSAVGDAAAEAEHQADAALTALATEQPDSQDAVEHAPALPADDMRDDQQLPSHDGGSGDCGNRLTGEAEPAAGPDDREDQSLLSRGGAKSSDPSSEPQRKRQHIEGGGSSGSDADPSDSETGEVRGGIKAATASNLHAGVMANHTERTGLDSKACQMQ